MLQYVTPETLTFLGENPHRLFLISDYQLVISRAVAPSRQKYVTDESTSIRNSGDAYRRPDNHTDMSEYWTGIPRAESGQETEMVVTT